MVNRCGRRVWIGSSARLALAGLVFAVAMPRVAFADGAPVPRPGWEKLQEGQQTALVRLGPDRTAHTDLFVSIADHSGESTEMTLLVPLGREAHDVEVESMDERTFNEAHPGPLNRRILNHWYAVSRYREGGRRSLMLGMLLPNGNFLGWLPVLRHAVFGIEEARPMVIDAEKVFETPGGRVAVYNLREQADVDNLIGHESLPAAFRQILEERRGQRLAVITLLTNPQSVGAAAREGLTSTPRLSMWDAASGRESPIPVAVDSQVQVLAASATSVVVGTKQSILLWRGGQLNTIGREPASELVLLVLSRDGTRLVGVERQRVVLWDTVNLARIRVWGSADLVRSEDPLELNGASFSADGRYLALSGSQVDVLDTWTGTIVFSTAGREDFGPSIGATFSPDGRWLAVIPSQREAELYDTETFSPRQRIGRGWPYLWPTFSTDGARLAAAGPDGDIWVWNMESASIQGRVSIGKSLRSLGFVDQGTTVAAIDEMGTIHLWRPGLDGEPARHRTHGRPEAVTIGGGRIVLARPQATSHRAQDEGEGGIRLGWSAALQRTPSGGLSHHYPLGTGKGWAQPIPLTRVYVVGPPEVGFSVDAPAIGVDLSGFTTDEWSRIEPRIHRAQGDQPAHAFDMVTTPEGQLWRGVYTHANPGRDIAITLRGPPPLPSAYTEPTLARCLWVGAGLVAALLGWVGAWFYVAGTQLTQETSRLAMVRDAVYWMVVGPVRSFAFVPFVYLGVLAEASLSGRQLMPHQVLLGFSLAVLGHMMIARSFARWNDGESIQQRYGRGRGAQITYLGVAAIANLVTLIVTFAACLQLGLVE